MPERRSWAFEVSRFPGGERVRLTVSATRAGRVIVRGLRPEAITFSPTQADTRSGEIWAVARSLPAGGVCGATPDGDDKPYVLFPPDVAVEIAEALHRAACVAARHLRRTVSWPEVYAAMARPRGTRSGR